MKKNIEEPGVKLTGSEVRMLAAMAYGEASSQNNADEMYALASVLKEQRDARGYSSMAAFVRGEPSFSFVVGEGNQRYQHFQRSTDTQILSDPALKTAV